MGWSGHLDSVWFSVRCNRRALYYGNLTYLVKLNAWLNVGLDVCARISRVHFL